MRAHYTDAAPGRPAGTRQAATGKRREDKSELSTAKMSAGDGPWYGFGSEGGRAGLAGGGGGGRRRGAEGGRDRCMLGAFFASRFF